MIEWTTPLPPPSATSTAVVTGASSGIGADIARELAARGHGLNLVARRADKLAELAAELTGVRVEVIACDVADAQARGGLFEEVERREVAQVRVNVEALIDLTTRAVGQMVPRGRGAILNVGSTAGFQPFPGQAG